MEPGAVKEEGSAVDGPGPADPQPDPSCDFDPASISAGEAMERVLASIRPITQVERVNLRAALGRVIA